MRRKKAVLRLGQGVCDAISRFKASSPYTGGHAERMVKFSALVEALSKEYNVETPSVYVTNREAPTGQFDDILDFEVGEYDHRRLVISMRKFSILSVLHEFRHHLQCKWKDIKMFSADREEDANVWSQAVLKQWFEGKFFELRRQGKLLKTRMVV